MDSSSSLHRSHDDSAGRSSWSEPERGNPEWGEDKTKADEQLLAGWEKHWDEGNRRHYFSNAMTGETSWILPEAGPEGISEGGQPVSLEVWPEPPQEELEEPEPRLECIPFHQHAAAREIQRSFRGRRSRLVAACREC